MHVNIIHKLMKKIIVVFFLLTVNTIHAQTIINSSKYDSGEIADLASICLKILNVDSCIIFIKEMPSIKIRSIAFRSIEVCSTVVPEGENVYSVYLAPDQSYWEYRSSLIHELIHVSQYHKGELRVLEPGIVEFRGKTIKLQKVPYETRPFEVEARRMEQGIQYFIRNTLSRQSGG